MSEFRDQLKIILQEYLPKVFFSIIYEYSTDNICYKEEKLIRCIKHSEIESFNYQKGFNIFDQTIYFVTFLNRKLNIHTYHIITNNTIKYEFDYNLYSPNVVNIFKDDNLIKIVINLNKRYKYYEFLLECDPKTLKCTCIYSANGNNIISPIIKHIDNKCIYCDDYIYNIRKAQSIEWIDSPFYCNELTGKTHIHFDGNACCESEYESDMDSKGIILRIPNCTCHDNCYKESTLATFVHTSLEDNLMRNKEIGYLVHFDYYPILYICNNDELELHEDIINSKQIKLQTYYHNNIHDFRFNDIEICIIDSVRDINYLQQQLTYLYVFSKDTGNLIRRYLLDINNNIKVRMNDKYIVVNKENELYVHKRVY
jgi:hypothetical protein